MHCVRSSAAEANCGEELPYSYSIPSRLYLTVLPSSVTVSPFTLSGEVKHTVHTPALRVNSACAVTPSQATQPLMLISPFRSGISAFSAAVQDVHKRQDITAVVIIILLLIIRRPLQSNIGQREELSYSVEFTQDIWVKLRQL